MRYVTKGLVGLLAGLSIVAGGIYYLGNIKGIEKGRAVTAEEIRGVAERIEEKLKEKNLTIDERKYFSYFSSNLYTLADMMKEGKLTDSVNTERLQSLEKELLNQCEMMGR